MGVEGADESGEQSMRLASGYSSKFGYDTGELFEDVVGEGNA